MKSRLRKTIAFLAASGCVVTAGVAHAQQAYVADPDASRPTLHQHPPALPPVPRGVAPAAASGTVNGITFVDVLLASGYDTTSSDYGNEPGVTANPVAPGRIVLTSFSGSNWPTGGDSSIFYSGDGGASWVYSLSVPPPPGTSTNYYCPCDQTLDWGRDAILYATFLHYNVGDTISSVYSAQTATPTDPSSWVYRTNAGVAQKTNPASLIDVDQPWLWSGPLPGDDAQTNVCVGYDNFDAGYVNVETRAADSPAMNPLNFTRDAATGTDGRQYNDGMNAGNRIAVGPDGTIFDVYQRLVSVQASGVKQLTYLITASTDGGQTWSVANSDHPSGAKTVAANVYSFQGNGSKVGGVNALLGGVDAVGVDPATGTVWVVYGARSTLSAKDQLFLVPVTYSAGSLNVGTARAITPSTINAYLPAVAVLPNGEVGVLFQTFDGTNFGWQLVQTTDGGATLAKSTVLTSFTSPFTDNGQSNQRIFGDFVQLRAVGCAFYGAYAARGSGVNSVSSIDPYFMNAPPATSCSGPALTAIAPSAVCAGGPGFSMSLQGTGFAAGATGRIAGTLRTTTVGSSTQASMAVQASDIASPGTDSVDLVGALPAGGLTAGVPLAVEAPAASPGSTLLATKNGANVELDWGAASGATSYNVRRCKWTGAACTPTAIATPTGTSYLDPVLGDGSSYWYLIDAVNSCGATP